MLNAICWCKDCQSEPAMRYCSLWNLAWPVMVSLTILSFKKRHLDRRRVALAYKSTVQSLAIRCGILTTLNTIRPHNFLFYISSLSFSFVSWWGRRWWGSRRWLWYARFLGYLFLFPPLSITFPPNILEFQIFTLYFKKSKLTRKIVIK